MTTSSTKSVWTVLPEVPPLRHETGIERVSGIAKSGFDAKELGQYAVNPSLNCEAKCLYCSSHAVLGPLASYRSHVGDWWHCETFTYYTNVVEAVGRDAKRLGGRNIEVVMSTVVDPYQHRLVQKHFPRGILEQLAPTDLRLRILSKMTAAAADLPFIADTFGTRATVGTSIPVLNPRLSRVVEPYASPVEARHRKILGTAKQLGLRRYVMACPIIPGTYADYNDFAADWAPIVDVYDPEKIWFEPLNGRGKNLDMLERGLRAQGLLDIADRLKSIHTKESWAAYTLELLGWVQRFAHDRFEARRIRFLLYPTMLTEESRRRIKVDDATVIWL
jgi:DNA repair photolyase